jgi:hypothetical protein
MLRCPEGIASEFLIGASLLRREGLRPGVSNVRLNSKVIGTAFILELRGDVRVKQCPDGFTVKVVKGRQA